MTSRRKQKAPGQPSLPFSNWGGPRKGAGRKLQAEQGTVAHERRPRLSPHDPLHVTARLADGLPSLRQDAEITIFRSVLTQLIDRPNFRIVEYSVQSNHIHLIVEIDAPDALTNGMRSLMSRLVANWNRLWRRRGSVFPSRFHVHALRTPAEVRHALLYVLNNHYKHGGRPTRTLDPFASGAWFDGWMESFTIEGIDDIPIHLMPAQTWLLKSGWRRHHRIRLDESPLLDRRRPRRRQETRVIAARTPLD